MTTRLVLAAALMIAPLVSGCMAPADTSSAGGFPPANGWIDERQGLIILPSSPPIAEPEPLAEPPSYPPIAEPLPPREGAWLPHRHYRQPPVTEPPVTEPEPSPPVVDQPPLTPSEPEPDQYSLRDRLRDGWRSLFGEPSQSAPAPPAAGNDDCQGAWRICHFF